MRVHAVVSDRQRWSLTRSSLLDVRRVGLEFSLEQKLGEDGLCIGLDVLAIAYSVKLLPGCMDPSCSTQGITLN
jgi:hypothetical protein